MGTRWVEVYSRDPVFVALTCHNILIVVEIPDLPSAVITSSSDDLLLSVESHASDSLRMGVDFLTTGASLIPGIILLREHRVRSGVLRPWSILSLKLHASVSLTSRSLLPHTVLNLLLDHLFMSFDSSLNLCNLFVSLVFL